MTLPLQSLESLAFCTFGIVGLMLPLLCCKGCRPVTLTSGKLLEVRGDVTVILLSLCNNYDNYMDEYTVTGTELKKKKTVL